MRSPATPPPLCARCNAPTLVRQLKCGVFTWLRTTEAPVPATSLLDAPGARLAWSSSAPASASLPPACGSRDGSHGSSPASDRRSETSRCSPLRSELWRPDESSSSAPSDHRSGSGPASPAHSVAPVPLGSARLAARRRPPAPASAIHTPRVRQQQTTRHFELSSHPYNCLLGTEVPLDFLIPYNPPLPRMSHSLPSPQARIYLIFEVALNLLVGRSALLRPIQARRKHKFRTAFQRQAAESSHAERPPRLQKVALATCSLF